MVNALRFENLAPLGGIVMVVLMVIGFLLIWPLDYFPSAERALEIFSEDPPRVQRGALLAGFYSVVFLLLFAGSVFSALRNAPGGSGIMAAFALGGGVVTAIGMAIGCGIIWVAAARAGRIGDLTPEAALIMNDLSLVMLANVLSFGLAVFIGATGIGSLQTNLFPAWFGWISVVFAIGLLSPVHYIFEGLAFIWIPVVSIWLYLLGTAWGMSWEASNTMLINI
jgi:hypothetical protein